MFRMRDRKSTLVDPIVACAALDAEMTASDRHDRSHSDTSLSAYAAASERTNVLYRELAAVAG